MANFCEFPANFPEDTRLSNAEQTAIPTRAHEAPHRDEGPQCGVNSSLSKQQSLGVAAAASSGCADAAASDAEAAGAAKWAGGGSALGAAAFGVFLRLDVTNFSVFIRFAHIIASFFLFTV